MDFKDKYIKELYDSVCKQYHKAVSVGHGRPHEYEHNHFLLTEKIAKYLIEKEDKSLEGKGCDDDCDLVKSAYNFAVEKHEGQLDDCGKDYFESHVLQVYNILKTVTDDEDILCAGLLHDTIEDTDTVYEELVENFNEHIASIVMEVTHEGSKDNYGYYFPRLETQEGILVKFADRLSNLSRMENWSADRKVQYLKRSKFWKDGSDKIQYKRFSEL